MKTESKLLAGCTFWERVCGVRERGCSPLPKKRAVVVIATGIAVISAYAGSPLDEPSFQRTITLGSEIERGAAAILSSARFGNGRDEQAIDAVVQANTDTVAIACLAVATVAIGFVAVNVWRDNRVANPFVVGHFSPAPIFPPGSLPSSTPRHHHKRLRLDSGGE